MEKGKISKMIIALCLVVLPVSCGTAVRVGRQQHGAVQKQEVTVEPQQETTTQRDTLPPQNQPPVVVPHTWRESYMSE